MNAQVCLAVLLGLAAVADDLARRHIANWIPAAALAGGFGWQVGSAGWIGALSATGGTAAGFTVFLVFYLLGGMGGGDIKLMAGFGALLGPMGVLEAAFWTALAGGVIALGAIAWVKLQRVFRAGTAGSQTKSAESIPYAPAIALGVWLALLPKG